MGILFGELERWAKIILCRALDGACEFYALSLTIFVFVFLSRVWPPPWFLEWLLPTSFGFQTILSEDLKMDREIIFQNWTLCDPMDYTVHGIFQAKQLDWVAVPFSRGSSQPRNQTQVCCTAGRFFTSSATREAQRGRVNISKYGGERHCSPGLRGGKKEKA